MHKAGRVLSLYIGRRQDVRIGSQSEPTAFVRTGTEGPLRLDVSGFEGSEFGTPRRLGQSNHAVYLFHKAHYPYFEDVLKRPVSPGAFAENVTYDGPDEGELRIGDKVRLGGAVVELTLPRIPCYKLAHFLETEAGFPSRFSASGKTGVYARVVEPGLVSPGDDFTVIETDPRNATIEDLNSVLTGPRPGADLLARVKNSPALLQGLQEQIDERIATLGMDIDLTPRTVQVLERTEECQGVVSLGFRVNPPPDNPPQPGQFVTFGVRDDAGTEHFRCYSLIEAPFADNPSDMWRIAVKLGPQNWDVFSVSRWIHDQIKTGATCTLYPHAGEFTLPDTLSGPLVFIAGGIGITPILAHVRALAAMGYGDPVTLVYAVPTVSDLAFGDILAACAEEMAALRLQVYLTQADTVPAAAPEEWRVGRPDLAEAVAQAGDDGHVFVCGPVQMIETVRAAHAALGRRTDRLHFELFSDEGADGVSLPSAASAEISLPSQGFRGTWQRGDGPLLGWIERHANLRLPAACRSGLCRTCRASLLRGEVVYPKTVSAPPGTEVLLCCAEPATDLEIGINETTGVAVAE